MNQLYLMDTCFVDGRFKGYPFPVQCAMTADLGIEAILPIANCVSPHDLAQAPHDHGISLAAVYHTAHLNDTADDLQRALDHIPAGVDIELSVNGDVSFDDGLGSACTLLDAALAYAEDRDCRICLYPHIKYYTDRIEKTVALCQRYQSDRLQTVFCGFHWYNEDGTELPQRITAAMPYLAGVNVCGSREGGKVAGYTIEALDGGELDNAALLGLLAHHGFTGRIGIQGYGIGGDPYAHLTRSVPWLRSTLERVRAHPEWFAHLSA
ncbi:MAG: TIM barrel protein [Planctomycetota bacterium]|jgi:hypothetical protein|nr:TIM barrel protein [Planctomycetota bacterium]